MTTLNREPLCKLPRKIVGRCTDEWLHANAKLMMRAFARWFDESTLNDLVLLFGNERDGWSDTARRQLYIRLAIAVCPEIRDAVWKAQKNRVLVPRSARDYKLAVKVYNKLKKADYLDNTRKDWLCLAVMGTTDFKLATRQQLLDLNAILHVTYWAQEADHAQ